MSYLIPSCLPLSTGRRRQSQSEGTAPERQWFRNSWNEKLVLTSETRNSELWGYGIEGARTGSVHHENYAHLKIFLFVTLVSLCGLICWRTFRHKKSITEVFHLWVGQRTEAQAIEEVPALRRDSRMSFKKMLGEYNKSLEEGPVSDRIHKEKQRAIH